MILKVKKLHEDAFVPERAYSTDAGIDLYNLYTNVFKPFEIRKIKTGIALQVVNDLNGPERINENVFIKIFDRSGIGSKTPLLVKAGVIDCGFTGEISIIIQNVSPESFTLQAQTKCCQACPIVKPTINSFELVEELIETDRSSKGFGSSDKEL